MPANVVFWRSIAEFHAMITAAHRLFQVGGFSPLSLAPALWLSDTGSNAAEWTDISGNSRTPFQTTGVRQPAIVTNVLNGRQVRRFDGTNDFLTSPLFGGTQSWWRCCVVVPRGSTGGIIAGWGNSFESPNPGADFLAYGTSFFESAQNGSVGTSLLTNKRTGASYGLGTPRIVTQVCNGTNAGNIMRINGVQDNPTTVFSGSPGNFTKTATSLALGAYNSGLFPSQSDIAEFLHIPGVPTAQQISNLERFLANKYAITI